jgi:hypothetical protein
MTDTTDMPAVSGAGIAWLFIFLLVLVGLAVMVAHGNHKETRDRTNEACKAACDAEKQQLRDALTQNQLIVSQAQQTRDAIAAQAAQANSMAYNSLQMKFYESLITQNNIINGLHTKIAVDDSNSQINSVLCTKANAPQVSALGCSPCVVNPNNFGCCSNGTL